MSGSFLVETLSTNLATVHSQIAAACSRSGRSPDAIRLVAVTKYAEWPWVQALASLHSIFGENRPQQLAERAPRLPDVQWHLIGQLQRNKARLAVQHAAMIHSIDSLKLLSRLADVASEMQRFPELLLQVNVSGEESKSGFAVDELVEAWPRIAALSRTLNIVGLMTMAPASEDPEAARPTFRHLAELRDRLTRMPPSADYGLTLPELSMGMSGDYVVALEEGATIVRIGSRLFEGIV
ncbi:MAG: YggS family pyridoxal phosphate-dependent enzyme [Fuerstiella sp.]